MAWLLCRLSCLKGTKQFVLTSSGVWNDLSLLVEAPPKATIPSGTQSVQVTVAPSGPIVISRRQVNLLRGRVMKTTRSFAFLSSFLAFAILFPLGGFRANAQSANSQPPNAAQATTVPARITQAIDETQLVPIKGGVHPLARPEFDRGVVPDATPMNRMLLLLQRSPDQEAALQKLMLDQMSKSSPNFHNWLTPARFGAQFGPADADVQTVTDWLGSHGFHDIKVATGRLTIEFSGDVGLVRNTFHTDIHHFFVNGETRQANVSDPMIPAALTPVVAGIVSLNNFPKQSMRRTAGTFTGTHNSNGIPQLTGPANCGTTGNPPCFFGVGPADFAAIYDIPSTMTGAGSKIAIVGTSDIDPNDVQSFRTLFGLANNPPVIVHNGPAPGISGPTGEEGEADLDVEWSGAVAPMAQIDFVVSEDTLTIGGLELSSLYVVDNNSDDIMSLSFGSCELHLATTGENAFINALWEQAAAQGITVFVSAGDPGSAGCDDFNAEALATQGLAVNGLASTPFNVAVGGTDFDDFTNQTTFWNTTNAAGTRQSAIGYIPERTWNDSCAATAISTTLNSVCAGANATNIVGGSGGPSTCGIVNAGACSGYAKPPWQTGPGVPADGVRDLPDVSLFASNGPQSHSFYAVCQADAGTSCSSTGQFSVLEVGGTSASSPSFAGILALIEQSERTRVPGSSGRQGNANFVFYKIAQTAADVCSSSSRTNPATGPGTCVFNDITNGNNSVPCDGASKNCSSTTSGTNGVLVDPAHTTTPAWTTTPGYDLATGLGSVNVANLATAWGTAVVAFNPTTTTTTINGGAGPVTITHGASVTLGATVKGTGTPSGDVSWLAPTSVNGGLAEQTLSGGTATLTGFTFLPGGTYSVKAHYAGDGNFAPSDDSTGVPVVVHPENSRLQYELVTLDPATGAIINPNATTVTYGTYFLRMDILNSTTNPCQILLNGGTISGCAFDATGNVTIMDNGSPLSGSPFGVNSQGHAEDQLSNLTVGAHTLSGTYSGDISYNAVTTAVTDNVTVTQAATATGLTPAANSVLANQTTTLSVVIGTQSISTQGPTGNVTFKDGSATLGTVAAVPVGATPTTFAGATATLSATFTTLGTHSLTAVYAGDANYTTSTSTAVSITVTSPGSFTLSSTALTLSSSTGAAAASTITVTPSGGFFGSVVVTAGSLPSGVTCPSSPLTIPVPSGTTTPVTGTLNCQVTASSSTLSAANITESQMYEAKATPVAPSAAGSKGSAKGWWALSTGSGFAALLLIFLPGGRKRLHAALGLGLVCLLSFTLGCGGGYGGGGGGGGLTATTTGMTVNADKELSGTAFSFTVTVTGGTPAGTAQLFDGGTAIATAGASAAVSSGKATLTTSSLAVGTHAISVHYLGDAYTKASQSGSLNLTVSGNTTIAITTNPVATPAASAINVTVN